jgi:branched-chain amino acid transport system substrate-binding protein
MLAALGLGLAGCATPVQHSVNSNEIVIGVAGPMSGELAFFGEQERKGVAMAIKDINASGGLLGRQLRLALGDDQCDPARAIRAANDLVDQHAALVVGHFCSGSSIPASDVYAAAHVIQITPSSTNPRLTDDGAAKGVTTLFRISGRDDLQGVFAADWLAEHRPKAKIAVIRDGGAYGNLLTDRLLAEMKVKGLTPAIVSSYVEKTQDFSALLSSISNSQADIVYIGGYHNDFALILRQARAAGSKAEFIGADALNTSEFVSIAGSSAATGVRFSDAIYFADHPLAAKVVAAFRADGYEPEGYTLASYTAVQAWAAGVQRAGTLEAAKVASAIRSAPVDTVEGKLSWDAKGDVEQPRYAWFVWQGDHYAQDLAN